MTYTVKNGTWCKDNEKEYYSTTKTGLKAALKAGEITAGTRVVIHDSKYHAGQLIQSLNPNCPEGCFVPDGSAFDTSIYTELAEVFPDGNLPDMRECVLVMAGQNEHITTHNHDVFSAGEFKDDTAAIPEHTHSVHINDPGHEHSVSINDPGHGHSVSDPGHGHSVSGSADNVVTTGNVGLAGTTAPALTVVVSSVNISGTAEPSSTGISINGNTTGISASVNGNTTGISITLDPAEGVGSVTRTKQFGVYYYIAF